MKAISNFFQAINNFLNTGVEYMDTRLWNGKFIGDLSNSLDLTSQYLAKKLKKSYEKTSHFGPFAVIIHIVNIIWKILMKVPLFEIIASFIGTIVRLLVTYYPEFFIVFSITFTLSIVLLDLFLSSITSFCIVFLPIMIIIAGSVSALYYCIGKRERGEKISLRQSTFFIVRHSPVIGLPFITEWAVTLLSFVIFVIIALFFSYIFDLFKADWSASPFFWFFIITLGLFISTGIFFQSMIFPQAYLSTLLDGLSFQEALQISKKRVTARLSYFIFFYLLFYVFCIIFLWHTVLSSLYFGLTIGIYFLFAAGMLLAFLLRRKLGEIPITHEHTEHPQHQLYAFLKIIIIFGLVNYVLVSIFLIKEYPTITALVQQEHDNYLLSQDLKQYTNDAYGYTIAYPQSWSVYQWTPYSVTFYNNYTGTISGGVWMAITVSSYDDSIFNGLYNATPGIAANDPNTKEALIKIANLTIQGYPTVNYTIIKSSIPYTQYETHYLIHSGRNVYDISFTSTPAIDANDNDLFQELIDSFKFTQ